MNRDEAYVAIMHAAAKFQQQIAMILEGQVLSAERSRDWLCHHLSPATFRSHDDQAKQSLNVHEQLISVINGITKMEASLGKYLEVLIGPKESDADGGGSDFGGLFGGMGGIKNAGGGGDDDA